MEHHFHFHSRNPLTRCGQLNSLIPTVDLSVFKIKLQGSRVEVRACEDKNLEIRCGQGKVIVVSHANYGRTSVLPFCGSIFHFSTSCSSSVSLSKVSEMCNGKQNCDIEASNSIFGDPCRRTKKYLEVTYTCEFSP